MTVLPVQLAFSRRGRQRWFLSPFPNQPHSLYSALLWRHSHSGTFGEYAHRQTSERCGCSRVAHFGSLLIRFSSPPRLINEVCRAKIYCENCRSFQPIREPKPAKDDLNPYPWADIL